MTEYYIVSLKHTSKGDTALTLWGPNGAGYCYTQRRAGVYTEEYKQKFGHDPENVFVEKEKADKLFMHAKDCNDRFYALPNDTTVRTILGLSDKHMKPAKYKTCKMQFYIPKNEEDGV